jgi:hypothetical protein
VGRLILKPRPNPNGETEKREDPKDQDDIEHLESLCLAGKSDFWFTA